jgi:hypothetical protein
MGKKVQNQKNSLVSKHHKLCVQNRIHKILSSCQRPKGPWISFLRYNLFFASNNGEFNLFPCQFTTTGFKPLIFRSRNDRTSWPLGHRDRSLNVFQKCHNELISWNFKIRIFLLILLMISSCRDYLKTYYCRISFYSTQAITRDFLTLWQIFQFSWLYFIEISSRDLRVIKSSETTFAISVTEARV